MDPVNTILGSLFMSILVGFVFLFRSRHAPREAGYCKLSYSLPLKLFALFGSTLFIIGIIYLLKSAPLEEGLTGIATMLPILLLVFGGMVETLLFEIRYDRNSIRQSSPWSRDKEIPLEELAGITRSRLTDQTLLVSSQGVRIRVPAKLNGAEELMEAAAWVVEYNRMRLEQQEILPS